MTDSTRYEYRAVFSTPYGEPDSYGAAVANLADLPTSAPRSEETHGYVSGVQVRIVTAWSDPVKREELR